MERRTRRFPTIGRTRTATSCAGPESWRGCSASDSRCTQASTSTPVAPSPRWSGGAYGDRAAQRFVEVLGPREEILRYLALENDERIWTVAGVVEAARSLGVPAIVDTLHHVLNPGGLTLGEALDLALPTWEARGARPKLHLSSQDPGKRPGAHAYRVDPRDWHAPLSALDGRETDVMVEAKGEERSLVPMGAGIG